jgi:hypothetical protein
MEKFRWNVYADQPHNIASRKERLKHHLKHGASYLSLIASNSRWAYPVLGLYRKYRDRMYREPFRIESPFAVSVSPAGERNEEVIINLKEIGINKTLVRIPSWERKKLGRYEKFIEFLIKNEFEVTIALLQNREDVLSSIRWRSFVKEVFSQFERKSSFFEIGHAWNRTKWGVWDYKEYIKLAAPALSFARDYGVKLVGPAVIDFEFHLYPAVLKAVPFDKVSSLLYVDRQGAPENAQFGWTTAKKVALLKAIIDSCSPKGRDCWITEVNWPLKGTGRYSPASGKPNVSEDQQADYLVRYFVICLSSGLVERIYWWQLVAPGYGLIDSRPSEWRRRPSYKALKILIEYLEGSTFTEKADNSDLEMYIFSRRKENFALCWTKGPTCDFTFSRNVSRVLDREGKEVPFIFNRVKITGSPKYVFFE